MNPANKIFHKFSFEIFSLPIWNTNIYLLYAKGDFPQKLNSVRVVTLFLVNGGIILVVDQREMEVKCGFYQHHPFHMLLLSDGHIYRYILITKLQMSN